jgi:type I restriction enzyme S subunit
MNWEQLAFEDMYEIPSKNGLTRPAIVRGAGYKMINMGELFANEKIGSIPMELVPMNQTELRNMLVEPGDLLFARQSLVLSGAGKCSLVKEVSEPTTFESHIIRVRLKKDLANPEFYFYYFKSPLSPVKSIVTQGVQAGIRGNDLKRLEIHNPPLDVQNKICNILTKYDDLIENNKRRIALLEESARLLYREWFVHFRFPGHEHVKIIDGLPEGWNKKKYVDILGKVKKKGKAKKEEYQPVGLFPCIDQSKDFIGGYVDDTELVFSAPLPVLIFGDHTRIIKFIDFPFVQGADGTQILIPKNDDITPVFFYFLTQSIDLANAFYARHFKFLKATEIILPTNSLIKQFERSVEVNMKQIKTLREMNIKLEKARDILLPRLMNGDLAV